MSSPLAAGTFETCPNRQSLHRLSWWQVAVGPRLPRGLLHRPESARGQREKTNKSHGFGWVDRRRREVRGNLGG